MTATFDEPILDGMPEPIPAWLRPDEGVRMSALGLEHMLAAALAHVGVDDDLPVLQSIQIEVREGEITTRATDRYSLIRERRLVSQTCEAFTFLLRAEDASNLRILLRSVLRGVDKDERDTEPCDLAYERTDDGPTLRVLGHDLDVRFTEPHDTNEFPRFDPILDRATLALDAGEVEPFDAYINPTLLARLVPLQKAGRASSLFLFRRPPAPSPVVVQTLDEDDDVVVALMPLSGNDQ